MNCGLWKQKDDKGAFRSSIEFYLPGRFKAKHIDLVMHKQTIVIDGEMIQKDRGCVKRLASE